MIAHFIVDDKGFVVGTKNNCVNRVIIELYFLTHMVRQVSILFFCAACVNSNVLSCSHIMRQ